LELPLVTAKMSRGMRRSHQREEAQNHAAHLNTDVSVSPRRFAKSGCFLHKCQKFFRAFHFGTLMSINEQREIPSHRLIRSTIKCSRISFLEFIFLQILHGACEPGVSGKLRLVLRTSLQS
jgi:hypothetical protein